MLTTHSQHLETLWEYSGSLGTFENDAKHEGGRVVFIGLEKQRTFGQGAYVWHLYIAIQMLLRTSRYYPEGIRKSSICPVLWRMSGVQFAERTFGGPSLYIRTIDNSVRPPDLAYV